MSRRTKQQPGQRQRVQGPTVTRVAEIDATSIDQEARRVRVSFSSELPVLRQSWWDDDWVEVLGHDPSEVDLSRANAGAPVLYNHSRWDPSLRLGKIERAWIDGARGYADLVFSRRPEVDGYWTDIQDGILTSVSVGYAIDERTLVKAQKDAPSEYRVTRWTPMEISMVDIPADPTVGVGRMAQPPAAYRITDLPPTGAPTVEDEDPTATGASTDPTKPLTDPVDINSARSEASRAAQAADASRRQGIRDLCEPLRARYAFVADLERAALVGSQTPEQVSRAILAKMGEGAEPLGGELVQPNGGRVQAGADQRDKTREAGALYLLHRANVRELAPAHRGGTVQRIDINGNPWRGTTLLQMAERCLRAAGINPEGLDKMELVGRAFQQSASDFPILLEDAIHKELLNAYRLVPDTWTRFCKIGTVSDFRLHNRYLVGSLGNLDNVNENGEVRRKTIPDGARSQIAADSKGNIIGITRKAIVNDDLGSLMDLTTALGRAGRRTIEAAVHARLAENAGAGPLLADGKALFHADHHNIEATVVGKPTTATLWATALLIRTQTDLSGNDYLDLQPAVWLGPVGLSGDATETNAAEFDTTATASTKNQFTPNRSRGIVREVVGTARMTGNPWYLFADANECAALEVAFLDGNQEPRIETKDGWDIDGAELRALLDFGVAGHDHRGAAKNNGA